MKTIKTSDGITEIFDSVQEFSQTIKGREENGTFSNYRQLSQSETCGRDSFYKTRNFSEADGLLLDGDKKTAKLIKGEISNLRAKGAPGAENRRTMRRGPAGAVPCVAAYLSGDPKSMFRPETVKRAANVVNVIFNVASPGHVSANDILGVSVQALNFVTYMETKLKIRCELYAARCVKSNDKIFLLLVKVKDAGAPLNIQKVAYPLCHPSFLRRHGFSWFEKTDVPGRWLDSHYGYSTDVCPEMLPKNLKGAKILNLKNYVQMYDEFRQREEMQKALGLVTA